MSAAPLSVEVRYEGLDVLYAALDRRLLGEQGTARQERTAEFMFAAIELERLFGQAGAAIILTLEARIAELEGALEGMDARLSAKEIMAGQPQSTKADARTLVALVNAAARLAHAAPADVRADGGSQAAATARSAAIWVARDVFDYGFSRIGRGLGGRRASAIAATHERAELRRINDSEFRALTDQLRAEFMPVPHG